MCIIIVTVILAWMFIGLSAVIIDTFINEVDLDLVDCLIAMVSGPATILMIVLYKLEDNNKLPKWMSKNVIEHIK